MSTPPTDPCLEKKVIQNPVDLSKIREQLQLSQTELAEVLNIEAHNISKYEKNHSTIPLEVVMDLASRFNLSLDELLMSKPADEEEGILPEADWLLPMKETRAFFQREMEQYPFFKEGKERFSFHDTTQRPLEMPLEMARLADKSRHIYEELHLPLIAFTGLISTGKSTVINTILRENILPTDIKQTTSLPIFICSDSFKGDYLPEEHDFIVIKKELSGNRQWHRYISPNQFEFQTFDKESWCLTTEKLSELKNYVCFDGFEFQTEFPAAVFLFLPAEKFPILNHCHLLDLPGLNLSKNTEKKPTDSGRKLPEDCLSFLEKSQRVYYCSPSYRFLESSQVTLLHDVLLQCTSEKEAFFDKIVFLKTFSHLQTEPKAKDVLEFLQKQYGDFCHSEMKKTWVPLDFAPNNREICQDFYQNLLDFFHEYPEQSSHKVKKTLLEYWKINASIFFEKMEEQNAICSGKELFSSLDALERSFSKKKSMEQRIHREEEKETSVASYHKECLSEMRNVIQQYDSDYFIAYFEKVSATTETLPHALYCMELTIQQQLEEVMGKYDFMLLDDGMKPIQETFAQWKKLDKGNLFAGILELNTLFFLYPEDLLRNEEERNQKYDLFPYVWNNMERLYPILNMPLIPKKKPLCSPSFFFSFIEVLSDYKMVPNFQSPIAKRVSKRLQDELLWDKISDILFMSFYSAYERNNNLFFRYSSLAKEGKFLVQCVKNLEQSELAKNTDDLEKKIRTLKSKVFLQKDMETDHIIPASEILARQSGEITTSWLVAADLFNPISFLGQSGTSISKIKNENHLQQAKEEPLKQEKRLKQQNLKLAKLQKNEQDFLSFQHAWYNQDLESFLEERENFQEFALRYGKEQTQKYGICAVSSVRTAYQQCYPLEKITMEESLECFRQLLEKETNRPHFLLINEILFLENLIHLENKEVFLEKLMKNFSAQ